MVRDRWYLDGWFPAIDRAREIATARAAAHAALRGAELAAAAAAIDGWFPRISAAAVTASGSSGIWLTDQAGSRQVSPVGIGPIWAALALVFNRNDDRTTDVAGETVNAAYNDYSGSDTPERWAGFFAPSGGRVDLYDGTALLQQVPNACAARLGGSHFAYLVPYQADVRTLVIDGVSVTSGVIMDVKLSRGGEFYVYMVATGTYTRLMLDAAGRAVSLRDDEAPLVAFVGPGGEPWVMSGTGLGTFVRPIYSSLGYLIEGDLYYPDARMLDGKLFVAGSFSNGVPRYQWVDFAAPRIDLKELKPPVPIPTFSFSHPVMVAPFKDPEGRSGATHEISVNQTGMTVARPHFAAEDSLNGLLGEMLGIYTERSDDPSPVIAQADSMKTRVLVCRDAPGAWAPPKQLRAWDIPARELYLVQGESVAQSQARWRSEVQTLLSQWPSGDVCVVPMFYCQGGAPPDEVWPVSDVLSGLSVLSEIVNLSARIKVIAPFAYLRANGITGHPELEQAFGNLKSAAAQAGVATLTAVPPKPPDPPKPQPEEFIYSAKEYPVAQEEIGYIKVGPYFGRVVEAFAGQGPFGWYAVAFDREQPDEDCEWKLSKPDNRHSLVHAKVPCWAGADVKGAEDPFWYGKPNTGNDPDGNPYTRGILESPVLIKDPAAAKEGVELIVGYFTWPNRDPNGGTASPSFAWIKKAA